MSSTYVVVGRQPIFDRNLLITGYELLFRSPAFLESTGSHTPGDEMTATVFASVLSIGLTRLVGDKDVFCNADRGVLSGAVPLLLPPGRTTVEITECTEYDYEIEEGCRTLRQAGYRLALDDFRWFDGVEKLLPLIDVVKIDINRIGLDQALQLAKRLAPWGTRTLAHKIETEAELDTCLTADFDLFQGFALARPSNVCGATIEASALGALQLSAVVLDPEINIHEVERIIRRDPALTVQVLEIASLGALGETRRTVRSIREALVLLGTQRLRSWVTLLMLRSRRTTSADELITVLLRARICELLAPVDSAAFAFTAGMISALDRFLGLPTDQLITALPLDGELLAAAFSGSGPVGELVHRVIRFESGGSADPAIAAVTRPALDWAMQSAELLELS